jgi:hypothetical protein
MRLYVTITVALTINLPHENFESHFYFPYDIKTRKRNNTARHINFVVSGRPPAVTDEEIISAIREYDEPVLTTKEVASLIPIEQTGTLERLKTLRSEDKLRGKQVGQYQGWIWWLPESETTL